MPTLGFNQRETLLNTEPLKNGISMSRDLLRKVIGNGLDQPQARIVEEQCGLTAIQRLLAALGAAQSLWDTICNSIAPPSAPITQEQVDIAHEDLVRAFKDAQESIHDINSSQDADGSLTTDRAHAATIDALKTCFGSAPFRLSPANLQKLIPSGIHGQQGSSLLSLLNHHGFSAADRQRLGMIPCLQELIPVVTAWLSAQRGDIFKILLSAYTPLAKPLLATRQLQGNPKLINLATNFGAAQTTRIETDVSSHLRFGILGLYGLGKTTLVNALIGDELLTTGNGDWETTPFLSPGWPIIICHSQGAMIPTLSIDPINFIPILSILRREEFDPAENPLLEPVAVAMWEEYEKSRSSSSEMSALRFSGTSEIQNTLHSIGRLVRAFAPLERHDEEFQFNSSWPIINVCMAAFSDVERPLEFIDLPGIGNMRLRARDVEAQWKVALKSCDAFIYTIRAELALLDSENLDRNLKHLKLTMTNEGKPWLVVTTHKDRLPMNVEKRRKEEERFIRGFRRCIRRNGLIPFQVKVILCSPELDLCTKAAQKLVESSSELPSEEDIESVGGEIVLRGLGKAIDFSTLSHERVTEYLDSTIQDAAMVNVPTTINDTVIPSIAEWRARRTISLARDDALSIRVDLELRPTSGKCSIAETLYREILSTNFHGQEALDRQRQLTYNIFKTAANFCASWSVTQLEAQRDWFMSVEPHLAELEQSLQTHLDYIWNQTSSKNQVPAPDAVFVISRPSRPLKDFEKKAADAHFLCEIRVKELAGVAWVKTLHDLLDHLASHVFGVTEQDGYQHLQQRVYQEIHGVQKQSCEQILNKLVQKRGLLHGLDPSSLPEQAFWRAHEGRMQNRNYNSSSVDEFLHSITDLPRDSSSWVHTPRVRQQPTSISERAAYLEQWAEDAKIAANGFEAVGFLVVPSHVPMAMSNQALFTRFMDSGTLRKHLEISKKQWYESMRRQSLATLDGTLRAVSLIGIRTVLDVFIDNIQKLEANINLSAKETYLSEMEIEEMVAAESNAVCAWTALDELSKPK